ncbi:MAG: type II toxin-antitoxin system RelE/ParE family toxin [Pirellulales bacterium]|nr:type II toxin-antitoxin system RelE/ParE family toxin [Pirellulales bacterium]
MKKYRLIIQPPAFDDLDEAYQWIREQAPEAAARWFNGFVEALNSLITSPERCGLAPENDAVEPEIRQLLYGRRSGVYRALFTITRNEVHVLHIRHAARQTMTAEEFSNDL